MCDESTKTTHCNYIYVTSNLATNQQLIDSLHETFESYKNEFNGTNLEFESNIITKFDGSTFGYGYLWVKDKKLYYMLLGKNFDGSDLYIEEDDESWKPDPKIIEEKNKLIYEFQGDKSWYQISELEDELDKKLIRPKIKKVIQSPISQIKFKYNESQRKLDPTKTEDVFTFSPAVIRNKYDDNYSTNKLFSPVVNKNITENDLRKIFCKYSTSLSKNSNLYPIITIDNKKSHNQVTIKFDSTTNDGLFALLMTKKITISGHTIYFDYYKFKN
jgi:hypothetical protein